MSKERADFATRLGERREEQNLSESELARKLGMQVRQIKDYENVKSSVKGLPRLDTVMRIAEELDISLNWLCGISDKKDPYRYDQNNPANKAHKMLSHIVDIIEGENKDWDLIESIDLEYFNDELFEEVASLRKKTLMHDEDEFYNMTHDVLVDLVEKYEEYISIFHDVLDDIRKRFKPYGVIIGAKHRILKDFVQEYQDSFHEFNALVRSTRQKRERIEKFTADFKNSIYKDFFEELKALYTEESLENPEAKAELPESLESPEAKAELPESLEGNEPENLEESEPRNLEGNESESLEGEQP